jgi:hypothetical protein
MSPRCLSRWTGRTSDSAANLHRLGHAMRGFGVRAACFRFRDPRSLRNPLSVRRPVVPHRPRHAALWSARAEVRGRAAASCRFGDGAVSRQIQAISSPSSPVSLARKWSGSLMNIARKRQLAAPQAQPSALALQSALRAPVGLALPYVPSQALRIRSRSQSVAPRDKHGAAGCFAQTVSSEMLSFV